MTSSARYHVSPVTQRLVVKRRIGSPAVMYEQLSRLAAESERDNVDIRILPLDAQHTVFGESFVIFGFGTDGETSLQDVVSTEQLKSGFILEGERDTYLHRLAFEALTDSSLSREKSRELIRATAEDLWADSDSPAVSLPARAASLASG